jgi:hypothetical protein
MLIFELYNQFNSVIKLSDKVISFEFLFICKKFRMAFISPLIYFYQLNHFPPQVKVYYDAELLLLINIDII